MSELKICPFCGGEPRLLSLSHGFHVECQTSGCDVLVATINVPEKDDAIAAWNTRAESAELSEWRDLMIWGAGPDYVHDFIKGQQTRIHAAQLEAEELQRLLEVEKAAIALTERLEFIHNDPQYQSVWTLNQIRNGQYSGPKYSDELAALKSALQQRVGR